MPLEEDYTVPESAKDNTSIRCQRKPVGTSEHEIGRISSVGVGVSKSYEDIKYWTNHGNSDPRHC